MAVGHRKVSAQIVRRSSRHRSSSTIPPSTTLCLVIFQKLHLGDLRSLLHSTLTICTSITDDRLVHSYSFAPSHPRSPSLSHPFVGTTSNALQPLTRKKHHDESLIGTSKSRGKRIRSHISVEAEDRSGSTERVCGKESRQEKRADHQPERKVITRSSTCYKINPALPTRHQPGILPSCPHDLLPKSPCLPQLCLHTQPPLPPRLPV